MSRMSTRVAVVAAAAVAAGCLLAAAPVQAATPAHAIGGQPASVTGVADSDKSPNVTVKVIGKLPPLTGPADVYSQGSAIPSRVGVTPLATSTVPFDFYLYGVWNLTGRQFTSTQTEVCMDIEVTYTGGGPGYPPATHFYVSLSSGGYVRVPIDGIARSYCWWGVPTGKTLTFRYYFTDEPNTGSYSKVDGSGRVRYSWQ